MSSYTFFIQITIKIELWAVWAADCALWSQSAVNAGVLSALPNQLYISTVFRSHPKTMKVSICLLLGNFSDIWTFPPTPVLNHTYEPALGTRPSLFSCPAAAQGRSTFLWGFLGTTYSQPLQKEGPLYSETSTNAHLKSTLEYLSVGLIC